MKSNNKTIEFLIDELTKCSKRLTLLEGEVLNFSKKEKEYNHNRAIISKKNLYQEIINAITQLVNNSINLKDVIEYTVDILNKRILGINSASIYFVRDEYAVLNAQKGYNEEHLENFKSIPYPMGFTWKTLEEEKSIYVSDTVDDCFILNEGKELGVRSYISTPINNNGKSIGTVTINSLYSNAFGEEELNLLNMISNLIIVAVNKSNILKK